MGWSNGDEFRVWECRETEPAFRLGLMICFDREVPEAARCLAVLGADVIAVPHKTGNPSVTIIWLYPTIKADQESIPETSDEFSERNGI